MRPSRLPVAVVTAVTLGSGLIDIYSAIRPVSHTLPAVVEEVFPLEFRHISKIITVLIGFALVVSSINISRRKRRAFYFVLALSLGGVVFHLARGHNYGAAAASAALAALLVFSRGRFTVRSGIVDVRGSLARIVIMAALALAYGVAGFWLLDRRDFGINFQIADAARETLRYLVFIGDPSLAPHTRHAHFFLDSLYVTTSAAIAYIFYQVFRPVIYQFRTLPHERALAKSILERYGRSSLDFFKLWHDKSYFILPSEETFVAYRVASNFAIALGDPVGPDAEIERGIRAFAEFCAENDWGVGFHQTLPDFLPLYEKQGFRKLKLGDDAIIDLVSFSLDGKERKGLRHTVNKLEQSGIQYRWYSAPLSDQVLAQAKAVSDDWLGSRGRRERQFTLGTFLASYVRATPLGAAVDSEGRMLAFVNQIPSYAKGEATMDLMRFIPSAPAGIMDFLFVNVFAQLKADGYTRFNLGLAPMSGFQAGETPAIEEKAIHAVFQSLSFVFSYRGLRQYKAKFATSWEPRYSLYRTAIDLGRLAFALRDVSEIPRFKTGKRELPPEPAEAEDELLLSNP